MTDENTGAATGADAEAVGTIGQIQTVYGSAAGRVASGLFDKYDEIARTKVDEGGHYDRLTDEQKTAALRDHRLALAGKAHEDATQEYSKTVAEYHGKVNARKNEVRTKLFGGTTARRSWRGWRWPKTARCSRQHGLRPGRATLSYVARPLPWPPNAT